MTSRVRGRRSTSRMPHFADPWGYRKVVALERIADLHGREAAISVFRRGGHPHVAAIDLVEPFARCPVVQPERSMLRELRRRVSATMARYRMQNWLTPTQLRTIQALWIEGVSLREFARREGVKPAAIESRIDGVHTKAPEFYKWYRLKHRNRRRR